MMKQAPDIADSNSAYKVQVLDRAFGILDELAARGRPCGLVELARRMDLHKSTAHRLLHILERHGFVERSQATGDYRLGPKLLQLGTRYAAGLDLRERSAPHLSQLVKGTGETAHIGVLRQGQAISIAHCEARFSLRIPASVGRAWPAHACALGKAILAYLPDADAHELISGMELTPYTRNTITTPKQLLKEMRRIHVTGYAVDDEEYEEGLRCIAAPILDSASRVIASVAIEGPVTRLAKARIPALAALIMEAATNVSNAMGYPAGVVRGSERRE